MLTLCIIHAEQIRRCKLSVKSPHYYSRCMACYLYRDSSFNLMDIQMGIGTIFSPQWPPLLCLNESKCKCWNIEFWLDVFRPENVPSFWWDISRCPGQRFRCDPVQTCSQSTCRSWLLCITTCGLVDASLSMSILCISVCPFLSVHFPVRGLICSLLPVFFF